MGAKYLVYQEEIGTSGTHHLQGYIEMTRPVRFSHFAEWLPGAHFEIAAGSTDDNTKYCTKEECRVGGPYIFGKSTTQGQYNTTFLILGATRTAPPGA